jgi:hypothetical protein
MFSFRVVYHVGHESSVMRRMVALSDGSSDCINTRFWPVVTTNIVDDFNDRSTCLVNWRSTDKLICSFELGTRVRSVVREEAEYSSFNGLSRNWWRVLLAQGIVLEGGVEA